MARCTLAPRVKEYAEGAFATRSVQMYLSKWHFSLLVFIYFSFDRNLMAQQFRQMSNDVYHSEYNNGL